MEALSAGQDVVGDGEHVVRLVVGQMDLQQVQLAVEGVDEAAVAGQQVDGPDAAAGEAAVAGGEFIVDVGGGQQRHLRGAVVMADAMGDATLAGGQNLVYKSIHSKRLLA